jgi:two-component system, response regulator RegA
VTRKLETALVIDDDDAFRTTLQGALRRRGVRARTAATVDEGLVALEY